MSSTIVRPSKPVTAQIIKLSLCDAYSPKLWVAQSHFWPANKPDSFEEALQALSGGLARTLNELPALGGNIGRTSCDSRDATVNITTDAHVKLLHEDLTSDSDIPSYAALKAAGFPATEYAVPLSDPVSLKPVAEGSPLLTVKLNKLRGGIVLSFGFNHLMADATTIAVTERIWAAHTADVSAGIEQRTHKQSGDDEPSRLRMSTPIAGTPTSFEDPNWAIFPTMQSQLGLPTVATSLSQEALILEQAKQAHWATLEEAVDSPKWCMWYFSPQMLVQLKKDCSAALPAGQWVSTLDALIGLFWSRIAHLKRSSRGEQLSGKLMFPINIRSRIEPPLHPSYIGNAVDILACDAPLDDLENADRGWATGALTVRRTVTGWKQTRWESWLATVKNLPADQALCPNPVMLLDHRNLCFNDYSRSDSNILDWGRALGRVDRTRYMRPAGTMKGCATGVVIHPRLADGGLEIATTTTDELCALLQDDEVFKRYVKLACKFA